MEREIGQYGTLPAGAEFERGKGPDTEDGIDSNKVSYWQYVIRFETRVGSANVYRGRRTWRLLLQRVHRENNSR